MSDKDFHKLFELVIDEMLAIAEEDIDSFAQEEELDWEIWTLEEEDKMYKSKEMTVVYNKDDRHAKIIFRNCPGTMTIFIGDDRHDIDVGWGGQYPELKKKFIKLYRGVEYFREVEKRQEKLEAFYTAISDTFPRAVDKLIFEEVQDDKESGDD